MKRIEIGEARIWSNLIFDGINGRKQQNKFEINYERNLKEAEGLKS